MNKITLLTIATTILLTGGMFIYKDVKADEATSPKPPFFQELIDRFGLDENEVESFMAEKREERQAQGRERQEERLNEAVEAGVITKEQADALQSKREEMRVQHEQERQAHKQEMQTWAEQKGIDLNALHEYLGGPRPRGMGRMLYK